MDIDSMTPDALRRCLREALRENETLRRRLSEDGPTLSPFAMVVGHLLDGLSPPERDLAVNLAGTLR